MFVLSLRFLSVEIVEAVRKWDDLKRWERRDLGQTLRRMGLSYREISAVIPAHKGTLSGWCKDLGVPRAYRARRGEHRAEVGALLRSRAVERVADLREQARREATTLLDDPFWVAGVVAYWAEGSKRSNELSFSNSDPALVKLFIAWAERYLGVPPSRLTVKLHLHSGQDELERLTFWSETTASLCRTSGRHTSNQREPDTARTSSTTGQLRCGSEEAAR